jgi:hypothetical protein
VLQKGENVMQNNNNENNNKKVSPISIAVIKGLVSGSTRALITYLLNLVKE